MFYDMGATSTTATVVGKLWKTLESLPKNWCCLSS